jgi:hypothetical protein
MERITIAQLDIDTEALVKDAAQVSDRIAKLRDSQKELRKENQQGTEEYVKQAAEIKRLSAIQRAQQRSIISLTDETGKLSSVEERINDLTSKNIKVNQDATENTRELIRIRDILNTETEEGAAAVELINSKIDQNNAFLDKNSDEVTKNRRNVGNYKDSVKEALGEVDLFSGALGENQGVLNAFAPIFASIKAEFSDVISDFRGGAETTQDYTKAQKAAAAANAVTTNSLKLLRLALISTGVGALVVALGSLVAFLSRTQKGIDIVNEGAAVLKIVIQALLEPVVRLGEFLFEAFSSPQQAVKDLWQVIKGFILDRVEAVTSIFGGLATVIQGAFTLDRGKITEGIDQVKQVYIDDFNAIADVAKRTAAGVKNVIDEATEAAEAARELAKLRRENERFEISIQETNAALQQEADLLAGTADNATKSFAEREEAARRLAEVESERLSNNIEAARQREEIAEREFEIAQEAGQETNELLRAQQDAAAQRIAAEAELTNFVRENEQRLSELKQDRLERDLDFELDLTETRRRIALDFVNNEANAFEQRQAKLEETNQLINESFLRQGEIIQQFTDQRLDLNAIIAEDDAAKVLEQVRNLGLSEIVEGRLLEIIRDRQDALAENAEVQQNVEQQRIEQLDEQLQAEKDVLAAARETRRAEFDAYLEDLRNKGATETEIELEQERFRFEERTAQIEEQNMIRQEQLRAKLEAEQITKAEFDRLSKESEIQQNQELLRAEATFARTRIEITEAVAEAKLNLFSDLFANLATIFGENSKAGKAAAIAQATIDTFAGASKALASVPFPFNIAAAAATVAAGIANVNKITQQDTGSEFQGVEQAANSAGLKETKSRSNKVPKAEKGALFPIGGNRHSQGGTDFVGSDGTAFEAEQGEILGVLSRPAAEAFMSFNNLFSGGVMSRPGTFQTGGVPERGVGFNLDELADKIGIVLGDRIAELPNPIVGVQDISEGLTNRAEIVDGASF